MIIWIDAQMSPAIAAWLGANFAVKAVAVRDVGLRGAKDREIFLAARNAGAVVMLLRSGEPLVEISAI